MRSFFLACFVFVTLASFGCAGGTEQGAGTRQAAVPNLPHAMPVDPPGGSYMLTANTFAGDALHKMLLLRMGSGGGILVASFVNLHDFEQTSAFGRVASQQVASRLGQYGFRVIEARLASTLSMTPRTGEFMLTRETARLLADTYDANAVLVGNYSAEGSNVFISVRVVRLSDSAIMGAYEYYLPRDGDVGRLLAGNRGHGNSGDSVWAMHSQRTPSFSVGSKDVLASPQAGSKATRQISGKPASPAKSALQPATSSSTSSGGGEGAAVPRYVDAKENTASKTKREPTPQPVSKPVAPPVSTVEPIPLQKDADAPPNIPGGA